jgi:hypothetical protein
LLGSGADHSPPSGAAVPASLDESISDEFFSHAASANSVAMIHVRSSIDTALL